MILYLIRHGETDWNREGKLQGRADIMLNENGRRAARLTREGLKDVPFDVAFTSPLKRAKETAEIILEGRDIEIIEDERIIEICFGKYEGTKTSEADENIEHFLYRPEYYKACEHGESLEELFEREREFLEELCADPKYQDSTILISTHGAALSGLLCIIKEWPIADFWKGGLHKNCGFSVIEVKDGVPKIVKEAVLSYDEKDLK